MGAASFWEQGGGKGAREATSAWDKLTILSAGKSWTFPGVTEVNGARGQEIDQRKPQGAHGGALTFKGVPPVQLDILCTVWTAEQWDALQEVLAEIMPKPRGALTEAELKKAKEGRCFTALHPALTVLGVCQVAFETVSAPRPGPIVGSKQVAIKAREFFPPSKTPKTAVRAGSPSVSVVKELQDKNPYSRAGNAPQVKPSSSASYCGPTG